MNSEGLQTCTGSQIEGSHGNIPSLPCSIQRHVLSCFGLHLLWSKFSKSRSAFNRSGCNPIDPNIIISSPLKSQRPCNTINCCLNSKPYVSLLRNNKIYRQLNYVDIPWQLRRESDTKTRYNAKLHLCSI